jgi:hypothetical protein
MWHRIVWWIGIDVSEESATFIFSMEGAGFSDILEDRSPNIHCLMNLNFTDKYFGLYKKQY